MTWKILREVVIIINNNYTLSLIVSLNVFHIVVEFEKNELYKFYIYLIYIIYRILMTMRFAEKKEKKKEEKLEEACY